MKKWSWPIAGLLIIVGSLFAVGFSTRTFTQWGQPASMGNGQIKTFVTMNRTGKPVKVGVHFTAEALTGLPEEMSEIALAFPTSIEATPLTKFVLDWAPMGHEPEGVYTVPHFDFHFYAITDEERSLIKPGACTTEQDSRIPTPPGSVPVTCEVFDRAMQQLPADMLPPDYNLVPAVVPFMGNHLMDFTGPELNDEPFTHTWIYGVYGGKITFFEPMITKAFLEAKPHMCQSIKTPEAMPSTGWYPTEYCIKHFEQPNVYTVSLESFKWFEASNGRLASNGNLAQDNQPEFAGHNH